MTSRGRLIRQGKMATKFDGVTILLADDEPAIRTLIGTALTDAGYRVLTARNGNEAMKIFDEHGSEIDMLITDMRMPYVSGAELVATLRARRKSLKCLCISGYAVDPEVGEPLLAKPFSRKELLKTVYAVLAA